MKCDGIEIEKPEARSQKPEEVRSTKGKDRLKAGLRTEHGRDARATLVIGYGNGMRSDDGVGPAVAGWLREKVGELAQVELVEAYQLGPEMAERVSGAGRVIFVDASVSAKAGRVEVRRARANTQWAPGVGHRVSPEMILTLAEALYGRAPLAWTVGVGVETLAVHEGLSPTVAAAGKRLAGHLGYWIRKREERSVKSEKR